MKRATTNRDQGVPKNAPRSPGWWWWRPRFQDHWNTSKSNAAKQSVAAIKLRDSILGDEHA